jgi:hypothetical protein
MLHSFHVIIKKIWTKARVLVIKIFVTAISNYIPTSFRQIFEPGQTETNVVVIVIEAVVIFFCRKRFGMQTMRVSVGRVPQTK